MKTLRRALVAGLVLSLALAAAGCRTTTPTAEKTGLHAASPDVVGMTQAQAEAEITDAGYEFGEVTTRSQPDTAAGSVLEQDPVAGTALPRGATIDVVVAAP